MPDTEAHGRHPYGLCAICHCPPEVRNGVERKLAVDHSHKSGRNRALLCSRCNLVLGHCQDQPELLRRLMEYLLSHGERRDTFIEDNPETTAAREAEWLRSLSELESIGVPVDGTAD